MRYLIEIAFDCDARPEHDEYRFEYKGRRFKLQLEPTYPRYSHHLLMELPDGSENEQRQAFALASEFASAFCWESQSAVFVRSASSGPLLVKSLAEAEPRCRVFPTIQYRGDVRGVKLQALPSIETKKQKRALILYRHGLAANLDYFAFLFFWQVLDVAGGSPKTYAEQAYDDGAPELAYEWKEIEEIAKDGNEFAEYLENDCRHAVAHFKRDRKGRSLSLDSTAEQHRFYFDTKIAQALARSYIVKQLGLTDRVYLRSRKTDGFQVFESDPPAQVR